MQRLAFCSCVKSRNKRRQHFCSLTGFTLIELLVVISILAVMLTILYSSFQMGLKAYRYTETALVDQREGEVFLFQLGRELRSAIPYTQSKEQEKNQFVGKKNSLRFPVLLQHYGTKGVEENVYLVGYEIKGRSLIRTERRLKPKSFRDKKETNEVLFKKLKDCQFEYLYLDRSEKLVWDNDWLNNPYVGLPRGVRITLAGNIFGKENKVFEILIPHGVLIKKHQ